MTPTPTPLILHSTITPFENVSKEEWDNIWPSQGENYGYYLAESRSGIKGVEFLCLRVYQGDRLVGVLPFFIADFNFQLALEGKTRKFLGAIQRWWTRFLVVKTLFAGTMSGEQFCLGLHPDVADSPGIYAEIDCALVAFAREHRVSMIVLKDVASFSLPVATRMGQYGYSRNEALAMAYLPITYRSVEQYINSLSSNMKKDLTRKIKKSASLGGVTVEETKNIDAVIDQVLALYENVSNKKEEQFIKLTREYFSDLSKLVPQTFFFLYWTGQGARRKLIGFNMCSDLPDRLIDRLIGLDYEASYDHGLYFTSFLNNIRWCIEHQKREYTLSVGGYAVKKRLGALTRPVLHMTKILNPLINQMAMMAQQQSGNVHQ